MAVWTNEEQPFGANHAPLLTGLSSVDGKNPVPVAVDPATGALITEGGSGASSVSISDGVSSTIKATVADLANSNPLAVEIVDGSGNQITSFGGGTQYTDGGTPPTHPVGPTLEFNNAGVWTTVGSTEPLPVTGPVSTTSATVAVGQTTSNTSAVQLSATSKPSTNGILVQGLSTNAASIFIGGSGVTVSTGYELQAGQAVPFTASNLTSLYVIGSNNSDGCCWNVT